MNKNLIKELENYPTIELNCYLDNNSIQIDELKEIELENYTITYRLEADILFEYKGGNYYQSPEINVLREDISVSELEVKDEDIIELSDTDYDKIVELIKEKIEY